MSVLHFRSLREYLLHLEAEAAEHETAAERAEPKSRRSRYDLAQEAAVQRATGSAKRSIVAQMRKMVIGPTARDAVFLIQEDIDRSVVE